MLIWICRTWPAETNARLRDFADLYTLSRHHPITATELAGSLTTTAAHHKATLWPLLPVLDQWAQTMQPEWQRWLRLQGLTDKLPGQLAELLTAITTFTDPILDGRIHTGTWNPHSYTWEENQQAQPPQV